MVVFVCLLVCFFIVIGREKKTARGKLSGEAH